MIQAIEDTLKACAANAGDPYFDVNGFRFTIRPDEAKELLGAIEGRRRSKAYLSKMKREAGYDDNVSFDVVWDELRAELADLRKRVGIREVAT